MHFNQLLAASAAIATITIAAPTGDDFGSVDTTASTVTREDTGRKVLRYGPKAYSRTLEKFGVAVPDNVKVAAAAATTSGTVAASPEQYDSEYLCPVQMGTPAQTLMLDFDTGSSDLWVFSNELSTAAKSGHSIYNPSQSSTSKQMTGSTWKISYGDNSMASGNVYTDKVSVGGVTVTSQAVEAAESVSAQFQQDTSLDGLLGLGGPKNNQISPNPQLTFFRNARPSLKTKTFAAYLKPGTTGAYDFGFLNTAHYSGAIHYTPADTTKGYWGLTPSGYSVGSSNYGSPGESIVDTGTSLIFVPDAVLNNYYTQVDTAQYSESQGGVVFACDDTLPDFSITVSGAKRTVPGSYINYAPLGDGSGYCYGGIQSADGLPFGILGDVFIKSQYVVFDAGATRIGFANQK